MPAGRARGRRAALAALFVTPVVGYFATLLALGLLAVPGVDVREAATVEVYVVSNGIHTDLVVPVRHGAIDWDDLFRSPALGAAGPGQTHLAIGWGHFEFYLATPTWADVAPGPLLRAALGIGPTALHVARTGPPATGPRARRVALTEAQYAALARHVRDTIALSPDGAMPPARRGYGPGDAFFPARGRVDVLHTCNEWTKLALVSAGVRAPVWSPLPWALLHHLPASPESARAR